MFHFMFHRKYSVTFHEAQLSNPKRPMPMGQSPARAVVKLTSWTCESSPFHSGPLLSHLWFTGPAWCSWGHNPSCSELALTYLRSLNKFESVCFFFLSFLSFREESNIRHCSNCPEPMDLFVFASVRYGVWLTFVNALRGYSLPGKKTPHHAFRVCWAMLYGRHVCWEIWDW